MLSRTLALLAATAVWGGTFVTVKDALDASDTFTFLTLRFAVGGLVAAVMGLVATRALADWRRVLVPGLKLGGLLYGGYALQTLGLESTTPARSAFVTGLTVLFVPFIAWFFTKQRPQGRAFIAPVLALFGLQRLTGVTWGDALPLGDVLTLGCAVAYAFHISATSRFGEGLPALPLTAVQLSVVSVLSLTSIPFVEHRFVPTPAYWGAVVFTGVFASAIAIGVQVWAQATLSAVRAAVIYALEPVFALLWSALSGLGWPSTSELLGGTFILAAVLVSEVRFDPRRKRTSTDAPV